MIAPHWLEDAPRAWLLLEGHHVPERWRDRATEVTLVPLLPQEARSVLVAGRTAPAVDPFEERLLALLGAGLRTGEIARRTGVPQRTIQRHLARLRRRFESNTNEELAAFAATVTPSRGASSSDVAAPAVDTGDDPTDTETERNEQNRSIGGRP